MISDEVGAHGRDAASTGAPWRRGLDVLDDYSGYAGGGELSEELADDLVNELVGLVGGGRSRRGRRPVHPGGRPGPQPSRPAIAPPAIRPRLTVVHGGACATP